MGKWTRGPWHQDDKVLSRVRDERDYTVCNALCDDRLEGDYLPNARLIAAAPEMAELLQKMLDRAGQLDPFTEQEARALLSRLEDK